MELLNLDTLEILRQIIEIQRDSYLSIMDDSISEEDKMFLMQFQSSEKELKTMAQTRLYQYNDLLRNKYLIFVMEDQELATMRHILYRMEDVWLQINPVGVRGCWELFFSIEEQRIPKIKYVNKLIKFTRNGNRN